MFDVGFWEMVVVGLIGLIVLGPERLPVAVRTVTSLIRRARHMTALLQSELERELELSRLKEERELLRKLEEELRTKMGAPPDKR